MRLWWIIRYNKVVTPTERLFIVMAFLDEGV